VNPAQQHVSDEFIKVWARLRSLAISLERDMDWRHGPRC
jgi:hypothetical protein